MRMCFICADAESMQVRGTSVLATQPGGSASRQRTCSEEQQHPLHPYPLNSLSLAGVKQAFLQPKMQQKQSNQHTPLSWNRAGKQVWCSAGTAAAFEECYQQAGELSQGSLQRGC